MTTNNSLISESYSLFFNIFKWALIVSLIFLLLSIIATTISVFKSPDVGFSFCLTNDCLKMTINLYSASIHIMQSILILFTSIATIGGIFIALKSYINTYNSSLLHNHISHFTLFKDFFKSEIDKRDKLKISNFDIFRWYNLMYPDSKIGSMNTSDNYIDIITNINVVIASSNEQVSIASDGSFLYRKHQHKLIEATLVLGVELSTLPRNNFYDVETQLLSLISVINNEFCGDSRIAKIEKRDYI
ncbi:retron Ec48 family effector membrane protein [Colwellia sp. E2M01]|uniref:retron Ec48 family effector membrane protein n=1 Tax=Colwellia sp. E2M01 TaxID=2841561 RepID=UPI001C086DB3|nr:retron Ec48 family effector membrane protein [Colwellia sp. E2M01]MBU2872366.1 retron Ec48 family effector membrane protein [Colwellia sp. E2M01]